MAINEKPELEIGRDQLEFLIAKAREFDVKDVPTDVNSGSNPSDDNMIDVLEDHDDDPVAEEIAAYINAMSVDEQIDLVALMWLGRSDDTSNDWSRLREEATHGHNDHTATYLLGTPLLGDHLEAGIAKLD